MKTHPREYRELDPHELVPYADNPRINDDAVQFVANSIEDYSFNDPIEVNEDMVVLSGHTRLKAALALGLERVPVIVISGMTETEQKAYRIAANKTQEKAGWDFEKLDRQVDELLGLKVDVERFGMSLAYLMDRGLPEPEEPDEDEPEEPAVMSAAPAPKKDEVIVRTGDVVVCGRHRLYCGDSSRPDSYAMLLDGARSAMSLPELASKLAGGGVLDPSVGTGATLMACDSLGRTCYGIDAEPSRIQMAASEWARRTGGEPCIIRDGGRVAWTL